MADLPGLIEGASLGAGLGFQFLRHIERTRVIIHVIDMSGVEGRDPFDDYLKINKELKDYDERLLLRPQVVVANKMDMENSNENLEKFKEKVKENNLDIDIIPISAYTNTNLDQVLYRVADLLDSIDIDAFKLDINNDEVVEYKFKGEKEPFELSQDEDGIWNVTGEMVQKYFDVTDFDHEENVKLFARRLRNLGVDNALRKVGVKHGDTVRILGYEFEFFD